MRKYPNDITKWISNHFSDIERVYTALSTIKFHERNRIVRCILVLSDSDYDSILAWVKKVGIDYRDVIFLAEYDNRNVRKYNFNFPLDKQKEYKYEE